MTANIYIGPFISLKGLSTIQTERNKYMQCSNKDCGFIRKGVLSVKFCDQCGSFIEIKEDCQEKSVLLSNCWMPVSTQVDPLEKFALVKQGAQAYLIQNIQFKELNTKWNVPNGFSLDFKDIDVQGELDKFKQLYAKELESLKEICEQKVLEVQWGLVFFD